MELIITSTSGSDDYIVYPNTPIILNYFGEEIMTLLGHGSSDNSYYLRVRSLNKYSFIDMNFDSLPDSVHIPLILDRDYFT